MPRPGREDHEYDADDAPLEGPIVGEDASPDENLTGWTDHGFPGGFLGILTLLAVAFGAGYLAYWLAGLLMYR